MTPCAVFKSGVAELGRLLIYETVREWLLTIKQQVESPFAFIDKVVLDSCEPVKVIQIYYLGSLLLEQVQQVLLYQTCWPY